MQLTCKSLHARISHTVERYGNSKTDAILIKRVLMPIKQWRAIIASITVQVDYSKL